MYVYVYIYLLNILKISYVIIICILYCKLSHRQLHLDELVEQTGERSALAGGAVNAGPRDGFFGRGWCVGAQVACGPLWENMGKHWKIWETMGNLLGKYGKIWENHGNIWEKRRHNMLVKR